MFSHSARISICVCCIALAAADAIGAQQRPVVTRQALVPSVTGISLDSARRVLAAFRLTDSIDRSVRGTAIVRTQDPAAGSPIPQNRTIRLGVSRRDLTAIVAGVAVRPAGISATADGPVVPRVAVPRVVGTSTDLAARRLSEVQLGMSSREVQTRTVAPGIVVSQDPPAGDSVPVRSTVTVTVAQAIPLVTVPDVTHMPLNRAVVWLRRAGLAVGEVKQTPSPETPQTVVSQLPVAGRSVEPQTPVALEIAVAEQRIVPDVTRRTIDDARQVLADARLSTMHDSTPAGGGPYGVVVRQLPTAGSPVPDNGQVRVLTLYRPPKVMPGVVGLTGTAARQRLADEGITLGSFDTRVSADSVELVVSQIPAAGQTVKTGTVAALTIGAQPLVVAGGNPPMEGTVTQPPIVVPDSVDVPPVIGRTLAEARRTLIARRLRVNAAISASGTDTVETETPVNVRVPVNTVVRLTVIARAASAATIAPTPPATPTIQPPPPPRDPGVNTNPPITPEENGGIETRRGFWAWMLGLAGVAALAVAGVLWKFFRNSSAEPTPASRASTSSAREPSPGITEPRMAFQFGRGTAADSVDSVNPPLITRSIELVPQIGTATSDIIGPLPAVEVINQEGR